MITFALLFYHFLLLILILQYINGVPRTGSGSVMHPDLFVDFGAI